MSTSLFPEKTIIIFLLGVILIGLGLFFSKIGLFDSKDKIEILNTTTESQNTTSEIIVEISGSVEKPGVYKLLGNSRVEDLLVVSGGLSASADRDWVSKNVNRASKLTDGQKVYIYSQSEVASAKESGGIKLDQQVLGDTSSTLVNINTSSLEKIMELPDIAQKRGQSIIEHRPYSTKEELVTKGVISQNIFEKIKDLITY